MHQDGRKENPMRLLTPKAILPLIGILLIAGFLAGGCSRGEKQLKIGDPAPHFSATSLDGRSISLASFEGNPVILRFWSTECKFCRADTPIFNRYFDHYREKGLGVIYINSEATVAEVRKFVKDLDIGFPVVAGGGAIAEKYHVKIVPQTIILNPDHRIAAVMLGGVSKDELQELLGKYFSEGGAP
jgi:peroxiredoxin